jgi:EAL domain-containing protein (putative c-di-GMP-specific phosphodiesterase class I)
VEYAEHPLVCFGLGWLSGHYARGALGDHDLRRARANARLRDACARGEVQLYYQPIVAASGHPLLAFEGLVRWSRNDGVVMPHDFLPDAECDRLTIWTLTVHTLEVAARDAASWPNGQARVFVNLAAPVIDQNELPHAVVDILGRTGLPADRLAVEVTEGGIISAGAAAASGLARLRDLGLGGIAIDDFGTGYSSLSRLDQLPVDTLKIDRELVAGTARDETRALTHGIVELAHSLGLAVIAEGVENASTREVLEALGCDAIQGYHVATPLPPDAVPAWLRGREA